MGAAVEGVVRRTEVAEAAGGQVRLCGLGESVGADYRVRHRVARGRADDLGPVLLEEDAGRQGFDIRVAGMLLGQVQGDDELGDFRGAPGPSERDADVDVACRRHRHFRHRETDHVVEVAVERGRLVDVQERPVEPLIEPLDRVGVPARRRALEGLVGVRRVGDDDLPPGHPVQYGIVQEVARHHHRIEPGDQRRHADPGDLVVLGQRLGDLRGVGLYPQHTPAGPVGEGRRVDILAGEGDVGSRRHLLRARRRVGLEANLAGEDHPQLRRARRRVGDAELQPQALRARVRGQHRDRAERGLGHDDAGRVDPGEVGRRQQEAQKIGHGATTSTTSVSARREWPRARSWYLHVPAASPLSRKAATAPSSAETRSIRLSSGPCRSTSIRS